MKQIIPFYRRNFTVRSNKQAVPVSMSLPDPCPAWTVDQVMRFYEPMFPAIMTCSAIIKQDLTNACTNVIIYES